MSESYNLGQKGEIIAKDYLLKLGYKILETNWRFGKEEIDIIALDDDQLVIVEVKTRSSDFFGGPEEFVSRAKQKHLIKAANAYMDNNALENEVRLDIIAITYKAELKIEHIKEAFYP